MTQAQILSLSSAPDTGSAGIVFPSRPRFTVDGGEPLERHLDRVRQEVRTAVREALPAGKVTAILLGGGYGRGEGGVWRTSTGERPYNDLEFYVALSGPRLLNELSHGAALREVAHALSLVAGIEVEFKIISLAELRTAPVTMFSYDLLMGHRWAWGDDRLLAGCEHHRKAERIPLAEATRLLMNRCTGLLFARERLHLAGFADDDADFVTRNFAKARLALGDALLTALGRYHWSARERHRRLAALALTDDLPNWLLAVQEHHRAGLEFKLHPERPRSPQLQLRATHEHLTALARDVWLWLETRRLGWAFATPRDYAYAPVNRCPGTAAWRNLALTARTFGPVAALAPGALRYPRARLLATLPLLLWEPGTVNDPAGLRHLPARLQTDAATHSHLVQAYEKLWLRFR
jgi:hypothetical protein